MSAPDQSVGGYENNNNFYEGQIPKQAGLGSYSLPIMPGL